MRDQPGESEEVLASDAGREVLSLSWLADEAAVLDAVLSDAAR